MFYAKNNTFYIEEETPTAYYVNWVQGGKWKTKKFIAIKSMDQLKKEVAEEFEINADDYEFLLYFDYPMEYYAISV